MAKPGAPAAGGATAVDWREAADALRTQVGRVGALLRSVDDATAPAVGEWTLAEVAMHLSQGWIVIPAMAADDLSPASEVVPSLTAGTGLKDIWDLGDVTVTGVRKDPERDPKVLAERIEARAEAFLATLSDQMVEAPHSWLIEGVKVELPTLICHLLIETTVHGYDMAHAAGRRWPIERPHAALIVDGFLMPVLARLGRTLVDQRKAAGLRITFEVRIRGGRRHLLTFDDGDLIVEAPGSRRVDCHISADPAAMLMVAMRRRGQWGAIARGQLLAWGRKPWLALRFRGLLRNP